MEIDKDNVKRTANNFSRVPSWRAILTGPEVDFLFEIYPDSIFCNGQLRRIIAKHIGLDSYEVYTIKF